MAKVRYFLLDAGLISKMPDVKYRDTFTIIEGEDKNQEPPDIIHWLYDKYVRMHPDRYIREKWQVQAAYVNATFADLTFIFQDIDVPKTKELDL